MSRCPDKFFVTTKNLVEGDTPTNKFIKLYFKKWKRYTVPVRKDILPRTPFHL
jgi:hypothetical protein